MVYLSHRCGRISAQCFHCCRLLYWVFHGVGDRWLEGGEGIVINEYSISNSHTYSVNIAVKFFIAAKWEYGAADGCYRRRQGQPRPLIITFSGIEIMLQKGVNYSADAKRRLYDRWRYVNSWREMVKDIRTRRHDS